MIWNPQSERYIHLEQEQHCPKWEGDGFDPVISAPLINKSNVSVLLKLLIPNTDVKY